MDNLNTVRSALKSQYHAALAMLQEAIDRCPADLWDDRTHGAAFWQVAYHTLFYAHMYLQPTLKDFQPWAEHQPDVQYPSALPGQPRAGSTLPLVPQPYSKAQMLAFLNLCDGLVDSGLSALDLHSTESGFPWYSCTKLEHQIISLRHIQHHTAQLGDRLSRLQGHGLSWLGH